MATIPQENIAEALDILDMATTSEKYVLTQLNMTVKQLADTNNILTEKIKTPMATNVLFTSNAGHHQ